MTYSSYEDESETADAWHECVEPAPAAVARVPPTPPPRSPRPVAPAPPDESRSPRFVCESSCSTEPEISTGVERLSSKGVSEDIEQSECTFIELGRFESHPGTAGLDDAYVENSECTSIEASNEGVCAPEVDTPPPQPERPPSELYYTASSEVSLLSDAVESPASLAANAAASARSEYVVAGHVAAMRERFESMTRTNTPCPGTERTTSPVPDAASALISSTDRLF